jgi:hypothetical protein
MFNHTRTYYEFIEAYPTILRTKIPLIQILMGVLYYILLPFAFLIVLFKKGLSIFTRIDITYGSEKNNMVDMLDMETYEKIEREEDNIIETNSIYYNPKESLEISKELKRKGFNLSKIKSTNFRIKKRIELCKSDFPEDDIEIVTLTIPRIAERIYDLFHLLKLA